MTFPFDIDKHTVYLVRHGSHAYGTNLPDSDQDSKGFLISPREIVNGFAFQFEQKEINPKNAPDGTKPEDVIDRVVYDIRKFCLLAAQCNPNIIEILFVDDSDVLSMTEAGKLIRDNRELFLSKKIQATFAGYAFAQLKRIQSHRKWLLDPPKECPKREDFGLGAVKVTPDMLGAMDKISSLKEGENQSFEIDPNVMQLVQREKEYRAARQYWDQYHSWKETRNIKRAGLEAKFGYDSKHAMHLVRLLRMCREIVEGKGVIVKRPDAKELLAVRAGEWTYDQLVEWAKKAEEETRVLSKMSPLPDAPDMRKLNDLCIQAQELFWANKR